MIMRNGHPDNRDLSLPDASLADTDGRGGPFSVTGEQRANNTIVLAFAPLHKAALGLASGVVFASIFALVTLVDLVVDPRQIAGLGLLAQYFYGYSVSIAGVFIGLAWGFVVGFVAGWFLAFTRNVVLAIWILYFRARADWLATRDLLDYV
ncbi:MAG TPA: hypothetical protein VN650_17335 [Gemmatimonadaceae bacterium]|nr:hypothetical protein [Gemmatimonadaceae bacterium]